MNSKEIYRIIDRQTSKVISVYIPPSASDVSEFDSVESARESNCHGIYKNESKYRIEKYKVTYELLDSDCK